jgi:hypothetical protein
MPDREKTPLELKDEQEANVSMIDRFGRLVVEAETRMHAGSAPTPAFVAELRAIYEETGGIARPGPDDPPEAHAAYHADLARLGGAPPMSPDAAKALLAQHAADELAKATAAKSVKDAKAVLALKAEQDAAAAEHAGVTTRPRPKLEEGYYEPARLRTDAEIAAHNQAAMNPPPPAPPPVPL